MATTKAGIAKHSSKQVERFDIDSDNEYEDLVGVSNEYEDVVDVSNIQYSSLAYIRGGDREEKHTCTGYEDITAMTTQRGQDNTRRPNSKSTNHLPAQIVSNNAMLDVVRDTVGLERKVSSGV